MAVAPPEKKRSESQVVLKGSVVLVGLPQSMWYEKPAIIRE